MLSQLNLNQLRIFQTVYFHKSMTKAAQKLFLTQSGVSQHIKNLENTINVVLFDRLGKNLVPTNMASILYQECASSMDNLEAALLRISKAEIKGTISIGAPPEFAQNILSPMLVALQNRHDGIVVNLQIGLASQMLQSLLAGEQNIAFMDDFVIDTRLSSHNVFDETIELCVHKDLLNKFASKINSHVLPEDFPLLEYLPGEPTLKKWYAHHCQKIPNKFNVVAYLSNSQNVARMIILARGAGVLTGHHIDDLQAHGHDVQRVIINKNPLINPISINTLKDKTMSSLEKTVRDFLVQSFADAQSSSSLCLKNSIDKPQ